jgi:hypothetical protein
MPMIAIRKYNPMMIRKPVPNLCDPSLSKKRGIWFYRSGKPSKASIPELIKKIREQRNREVAGT